jgi:hypothetical protein
MKTKFFKASSFLAIVLLLASCNKNATSPSSTQANKPNAERVDANNDGKISKSEAKGPLVNAFSKLDADGDGFITEKEFNEFTPPTQR